KYDEHMFGCQAGIEHMFERSRFACYRPVQEDDMENITTRQRRILEFIRETVHARGYPPTVREIGEAVGLTSSSSVHAQLANLERQGLLRRDPTSRGPWSSRARGEAGRTR